LSGNKSDLLTVHWLGALHSVPLSVSGSILNLAAKLIIDEHIGSGKSSTTAVSSVEDSDSVDPVVSIELNLPPLADSSVGVSEFRTVAESISGWIGVVAIVGRLSHTSHVEANLGVSLDVIGGRGGCSSRSR